MFGHRDSSSGPEMRSRHQRAGFLHKLPMSNPMSSKWQKRLFVAKDGFLLYYSPGTTADITHFDTKAKGAIPLGGCKVDMVERGPGSCRYGLRVTHPDFYAGRMLILAAETAAEQRAWFDTLNDCSRVTMENAKLGDAMIEKLRAQGTTAEKEKNEAMERLQAQAMALKAEQEEKLKLHQDAESLKAAAAAAEEKVKAKEAEVAALQAEVEARGAEMHAQANEMERAIADKAKALQAAAQEIEKMKGESGAVAEERARALEEEKLRLEREKTALERSVADLQESSNALKNTLDSAEQHRRALENQLSKLASEEGDLAKERQLRRRLERKLTIAEDSLKRLDAALRRSGIKLDIDVHADVKTLQAFFEERTEEVKRDAQRIDIMKKALKAKRRYLVATARAEGGGDELNEEADDGWEEDDVVVGGGGATSAPAPAPAPVVAAPAAAKAMTPQPPSAPKAGAGAGAAPSRTSLKPASANPRASLKPAAAGKGADDDDASSGGGSPSEDEAEGSSPGKAPAAASAPAGPMSIPSGSTFDLQGPLPAGWTFQRDDAPNPSTGELDTWYFQEATGETSWLRPNADGSIPPVPPAQ